MTSINFFSAVENANAVWPIHFVPGKRIKIATDRLQIHRSMWRGLGSIDHRHNAPFPGPCGTGPLRD